MNNAQRIAFETRVAKMIVNEALRQGYALSLYNGGDGAEIEKSTDGPALIKELCASDEDMLWFYKKWGNDIVYVGSVTLIYGNGYDVISDYSWTVALAGSDVMVKKILAPIERYVESKARRAYS